MLQEMCSWNSTGVVTKFDGNELNEIFNWKYYALDSLPSVFFSSFPNKPQLYSYTCMNICIICWNDNNKIT